jgi:hypothetical protein
MRSTSYREPATARGFPRYRSSGAVPIGGLLLGLVAGLASAIVLSIVYAYATIYIPIVQIEFLASIAFGAAIGGAAAATMHALHVRAAAWVVAATALLGIFGWAFSWLPWMYVLFARVDAGVELAMLLDPFFVLGTIGEIYENGTWSMGRNSSEAVHGVMLGVVWLGEMALIVGSSIAVGLAMTKDRVYCESCARWCDLEDGFGAFDVAQTEALHAALIDRGDLAPLGAMPLSSSDERYLLLKVASCAGCRETNAVALEEVTISVDGRGHRQEARKTRVPFLVLRGHELAELRSRSEERYRRYNEAFERAAG